jgi:hypothetical protein
VYPALDKVVEARSFLSEWVKVAQGQGENLALAQRIYSSEAPTLVIPRRFEDLAAADQRRRENLADSEWQGRLATLNGMLRAPIAQTLEETVVGLAASSEPVGVVRRVFFHAAPDTASQLRATLNEFVLGRHAEGQGAIALAQQIYSESGPLLILSTTHASMAALDQVRRDRAEAAQALVNSVAGFLRAPIAIRLLEPIVPFPSS